MLDLTSLPEDIWNASSRARLAAFFTVRDYSWHDAKTTNGLDEAFEIVVNGKPHRVANNSGVPVYPEQGSPNRAFRWHEFEIPKSELVRGPNEIIFRLVPPQGKKPDDYLYLGIDNSVPGRNSWVRFGKRRSLAAGPHHGSRRRHGRIHGPALPVHPPKAARSHLAPRGRGRRSPEAV